MSALLLMTAMILGGCDSEVGVVDIGGDDTGMAAPGDMPEDGEPGGGEMPEPEACSTDDECLESCPPDAADCVCFEELCAVACEADDDCPATPDGEEIACDTDLGLCELPQGAPPE